MVISKLNLTNYSIFQNLNMNFSPKINIISGGSGTGKSSIIQLLYCCISSISTNADIIQLLSQYSIDPHLLKHRNNNSFRFRLETKSAIFDKFIDCNFDNKSITIIKDSKYWNNKKDYTCIFFKHSYDFLGMCGINLCDSSKELVCQIEKKLGGKIYTKDESYFIELSNKYIITYDQLSKSQKTLIELYSIILRMEKAIHKFLFWDDIESYITPDFIEITISVMAHLLSSGCQIFISTNLYSFIKMLDLYTMNKGNEGIRYHLLSKSDKWDVAYSYSNLFDESNFPSEDIYGKIIDQEISNSMGNLGKI